MTKSEAVELLPCPFCGAKAEQVECTETDNIGGVVISCVNPQCYASTKVYFGEREGMVDSWNTRTPALPVWHPYPEEKPPESGKYIVFTRDGFTIMDYWNSRLRWKESSDERVIAWQELPKPFVKPEGYKG